MTPERSINHHFTYHVAQASQAKHGSLVDRGGNGGLAGSDVRILSRSSRKCTVTGIDSHELQGLDVVQCAALVCRQWLLFQGVENILDLLSWEEDELKAMPAQQVFSLDDHGQGSYLRTNQPKQICGLITNMKHVFSTYMSEGVRTDPFPPFSPDEWNHQTSTMMRTFLVQHLPPPIGPEPVTSGPILHLNLQHTLLQTMS